MSTADISKKRLAWQCRRGMLELDVLLKRYLDDCFDDLSTQQKENFSDLLTVEDPSLYAFLTLQETPPDEFRDIIDAIKQWNRTQS